jgi:hypothetical protein
MGACFVTDLGTALALSAIVVLSPLPDRCVTSGCGHNEAGGGIGNAAQREVTTNR